MPLFLLSQCLARHDMAAHRDQNLFRDKHRPQQTVPYEMIPQVKQPALLVFNNYILFTQRPQLRLYLVDAGFHVSHCLAALLGRIARMRQKRRLPTRVRQPLTVHSGPTQCWRWTSLATH